MKKYRFKTLEEFKKVYGDEWRDSLGHWFAPGMDPLFGVRLTSDENASVDFCLTNESSWFSLQKEVGNFSISLDMLVEMGVGLGVIFTPRAKNYRFKTQVEFEQGEGSDWRSRYHWNQEGGMDHLLGKTLTEIQNIGARSIIDGSTYSFEVDHWMIDRDMLKEITFSSYTTLNKNLIKGSRKILLDQNN